MSEGKFVASMTCVRNGSRLYSMKMKAIRLIMTGSLLSGAFFCVGMGMEMAPSQAQLDQQSAHSCCPGGAPEEEESSGPNCCAYVPTAAVSGIDHSDDDAVVVIASIPVRIVKTLEGTVVLSSRAPPIHRSPPFSPPSLRAPPAV